jgi:hypothetical protein
VRKLRRIFNLLFFCADRIFYLTACGLAQSLIVARCEVHRENFAAQEILDRFREESDGLLVHCLVLQRLVSTHIDHLPDMVIRQELPPRWGGDLGYNIMPVDDTEGDGDDLCEQL